MALTIQTRIEITGPATELGEIGRRMRSPRPFFRNVGLLGMASSARRLSRVLGKKTEDAVRTGRLAASLTVGDPGAVFELADFQVEFGSNLPYAAQVHYGGTIQPREAKALAIPLPVELKRARLWPSDLDPNRELLRFVPYTGSKPNVFGLLIDPGEGPGPRGGKGKGLTPYGPGPLYALAYWVTQEPRPFLYFDDEDIRVINEDLWPRFLGVG